MRSSHLFLTWISFITAFITTRHRCDAKVIVFFPVPGTSHIRYHTNVARAMADLGHEAWVCIPDFTTKIGQIDMSGVKVIHYAESFGDIEEYIKKKSKIHEVFFENKTQGMMSVMIDIQSIFNQLAMTFLHEGLIDKVKAVNPDLFVLDGLPFVKVMYVIPYKLDIPHAVIGSRHDVVSYRVPFSPAATPLPFSVNNDQMHFWSRIESTLAYFVLIIQPIFMEPDPVTIFAPEKPHKTLSTIMANAEIFIAELDPIMDYPRPALPNTKLIGGTAVKEAKALKDPFKTFIENSKNGVILVSFGSTLAHIPKYIFKKINAACKVTRMKIIWRSDEPSPDPPNILTKDWIPQNDILGHNKTRLFISHCGKNGQYESLYHGVPILCLPIFGDQPYNAERVRTKGYGLKADMRFASTDELSAMIQELVTNATYRRNMAKASKLFRLLYKSPMREAAFWLDHVMQFGGAYMRSASQKMPYYQFLMLDVLAFLFVAIFSIVSVFIYLIKTLCRRLFCTSKERKPKSE